MMVAQAFASAQPREIVLAGPRDHAAMREMLATIRRRFLPNAVVMMAGEAPLEMPAIDGQPTAYVCENYACNLPTNQVSRLDELIQ
jgi:hypothetical protein